MKELEHHDRESQNKAIEILKKQNEKVEYKLIDRIIPNKGHRVFEIDEKTLTVSEANYNLQKQISWWDALRMVANPNYKKEIQVKKNCSYVSALNADSALDRYKKGKGSSKRITGDWKGEVEDINQSKLF
jgi:hypothetical protein